MALEELYPVMIDPSVSSSKKHINALMRFEGTIYVPKTFWELALEDVERANSILNYFTWRREKICKEFFRLKVEPYRVIIEEEFIKEITLHLEFVPWPDDVKNILIEEYLFLRQHSSLLSRLKKTANLFKEIGMPVLDIGNKFKDKKEKFFQKIRGPRWFVMILLSLGTELPLSEPLQSLLWVGTFILLLMEP